LKDGFVSWHDLGERELTRARSRKDTDDFAAEITDRRSNEPRCPNTGPPSLLTVRV